MADKFKNKTSDIQNTEKASMVPYSKVGCLVASATVASVNDTRQSITNQNCRTRYDLIVGR